MDTTMHVPRPPQLSAERLKQPDYTIRARGPGGPVLAHYDPETQAGAVLHLMGELWAVYGPIPYAEFVATLGERGITVNDGDDLARWVTACSATPTGSAH